MQKKIKTLLIAAIIMFALSGAVTLIGALAKLQHWYFAAPFLMIGMTVQAISYLLGGIALVMYIRSK